MPPHSPSLEEASLHGLFFFFYRKRKERSCWLQPLRLLLVITQLTAAKFTRVNLGCHKPASNEVVILI